MEVDKNFADWAQSLAGCDGGDLEKSKIWISGIEYGYGKATNQSAENYAEELRDYYSRKLPRDFVEDNKPEKDTYDIAAETSYQFGRTLAKLYAAILGREVSDYQQVANESDGTEIFKLNLYPIGFPDTSDSYWHEYGLADITGLQTKGLYRTWCALHRFPHLADLVKKHRPKVIIGAGLTYLTEFALAFGGARGIGSFGQVKIPPKSEKNGHERDLYWGKIDDRTTLVVTPFFGNPRNLNSDDLIGKFGAKIKELME